MPDVLPDIDYELIAAMDLENIEAAGFGGAPDRSYQARTVEKFGEWYSALGPQSDRDHRQAAIYMATGLGKTRTAINCIQSLIGDGHGKVIWGAHRDILLNQTEMELRAAGVPYAVLSPNPTEKELQDAELAQVVLFSIPSLGRDCERQEQKLERVLTRFKPTMLCLDEAHHGQQEGMLYGNITNAALNAGAAVLHLTATPVSEQGGRYEPLFKGTVLVQMGIRQGIACGALVPPKYVGQTDYFQLENEKVRMDATRMSDLLEQRFTRPTEEECHTLTAMGYQRHRALYFAPSVQDAEELSVIMTRRGYNTALLTGEKALYNGIEEGRSELERLFKDGKIDVLANYNVGTEGMDLPEASLLAVNRESDSVILNTQILGRILRLYPGKDQAYVLDTAVLMGRKKEILDLSRAGDARIVGNLPMHFKSFDPAEFGKRVVEIVPEWMSMTPAKKAFFAKNIAGTIQALPPGADLASLEPFFPRGTFYQLCLEAGYSSASFRRVGLKPAPMEMLVERWSHLHATFEKFKDVPPYEEVFDSMVEEVRTGHIPPTLDMSGSVAESLRASGLPVSFRVINSSNSACLLPKDGAQCRAYRVAMVGNNVYDPRAGKVMGYNTFVNRMFPGQKCKYKDYLVD